MKEYMKDVNARPRLSKEKQEALLHELQQVRGTPRYFEIRNTLCEANLQLVIALAKNQLKRGLPKRNMIDAINAGNIGLLEAIENFDPSRGLQLSTYAYDKILKYIRLLKQDNVIRLPRHLFLSENETPCPVFDYKANITSKNYRIENTEENIFEDEKCVLSEILVSLTEQEREIIHKRFFESRTLAEIGEMIGVTRARIQQIEKKTLRRLKNLIQSRLEKKRLTHTGHICYNTHAGGASGTTD